MGLNRLQQGLEAHVLRSNPFYSVTEGPLYWFMAVASPWTYIWTASTIRSRSRSSAVCRQILHVCCGPCPGGRPTYAQVGRLPDPFDDRAHAPVPASCRAARRSTPKGQVDFIIMIAYSIGSL
jgi:hypothetical protein